MSTSTSTTVHTRAHTATHLGGAVMGAIAEILGSLGIDTSRLYRDWVQDEAAIEEESLNMVVLECHRPDGGVQPVFEFPVIYEPGGLAGKAFVSSQARLSRYQEKLTSVPSGTTYRLFCTFRSSRTTQPGWSTGTRASTEGLRSRSLGSLAEAPHARTSIRHLS